MIKFDAIREFREIFDESGIHILFSEYIKRMSIIVSAVFGVTVISSALIYSIFFHLTFQKLIVVIFSVSLVTTDLAAFAHLLYPLYRRSQIRSKIENSLIYTLSYMKIIAASGSSIEHIMERVADVEDNPQINHLARKFNSDVKLLGFDVTTALEDVSRRTPSNILKKTMEGINHNIKTSGDMMILFDYEIERLFQSKKEKLKSVIRSLTYLGEMYVALMVVGPILFLLMIIILSAFIGSGNTSAIQLNLVVFIGMPILASMFLVILDTVLEADI
jgi:flagellar protein FlaJ